MLKHTQGIIIPLVQVTVGFREDCSVWLHKTNNRSKVHELQKWTIHLTEITDIL
jgi:hypothetical protein